MRAVRYITGLFTPGGPTTNPAPAPGKQLPGLNSLRFFAALFVVLFHIPKTQGNMGLPNPLFGTLSARGEEAVCFFFTLSGFLITYLLLAERESTGTIAVRKFYMRRVLRIWPLYFLIVFVGMACYIVAGRLGQDVTSAFEVGAKHPVLYVPAALVMYALFLPNVLNGLYAMGSLVVGLWSIGVEEQFYAVWAPLVKRVGRALPVICGAILVVLLLVFHANSAGLFGSDRVHIIVMSLRFYFMAAGALCAWYAFHHYDALMRLPIFSSRVVQVALVLLLVDFLLFDSLGQLVGRFAGPVAWIDFNEGLQVLLFSWLVLTVSLNARNIVRVENRAFDYLGKISYGTYMYHMIVLYLVAGIFRLIPGSTANLVAYTAGFYGAAIALSLLISHLSYQYFEQPFLRMKVRRFEPRPTRSLEPTSAPEPPEQVPIPVAMKATV
jgi:peptidoglycan/LPS O-acetylase OafA/YrhL